MAPKSHGEKKGWSSLFYPPNGLNFQFGRFNLIFLIAPSWSESSFILFLFFHSIRVGPSRSELIRPRLAVRVDPVRLLYLPLLFVCSLMVDDIHCIFITFCTTEFNPWHNSFSFSLCFYWHLVSLLSHFCVVKTLLYFLLHFKFFNCLLPHGRCCLFLDVAAVYLVGFLFIRFLFVPYDWW